MALNIVPELCAIHYAVLKRGCRLRRFVGITKAFRLWSALAWVSAMVVVFIHASSALAQQALYPLKEGIVQPVHNSDIPSWLTLDMELRGRTEEQTSLGYVPG